MVPQGFGLIRELFGDEGQQKAFAVFGPVMGLAAVAGPLLGRRPRQPRPARDRVGARSSSSTSRSAWRRSSLGRALPAEDRAGGAGARDWTLLSVALAVVGGRRARVSADRGSRARLAGVVVRAARPAASSTLAAFAARQARRRARGAHAAGRAVDPSPASLRRRARGRARVHRRDGRDDDRAERDVPDRSRLHAAGLRRSRR